jgi:cyclophilin family peptidyl-prolyl cis-trans isomerase
MSNNIWVWILLVATALTLGCNDEDAEHFDAMHETMDTLVIVTTDFGEMVFWLYPETPIHRSNFFKLVEEGFYTGTEFHRVVENFVIQGGDPNSKDNDRSNDGGGGPGYTLEEEIDSSRFKHENGAIGAARLPDGTNPDRNSSGSQFYVVVNPNGTPFLDGNYTVFGRVLSGLEFAYQIAEVDVNDDDLPDVRIPMTMSLRELSLADINRLYDLGLTP